MTVKAKQSTKALQVAQELKIKLDLESEFAKRLAEDAEKREQERRDELEKLQKVFEELERKKMEQEERAQKAKAAVEKAQQELVRIAASAVDKSKRERAARKIQKLIKKRQREAAKAAPKLETAEDRKKIAEEALKRAMEEAALRRKEFETKKKKADAASIKLTDVMDRYRKVWNITTPDDFRLHESILTKRRKDAFLGERRLYLKQLRYPKPTPTFPKEIILYIGFHGSLEKPFLVPLKVDRRIAADFGTCNFSNLNKKRERHDYLTNHANTGPKLKSFLDSEIEWFQETRLDKDHENYMKYVQRKHYTKTKTFKTGQPMFDKSLSSDQYSRIIARDINSHITGSKFLYSIDASNYKNLKLSNLLQYFATNGVRHVSMYDFSCSQYEGDPEDFKYFGGAN